MKFVLGIFVDRATRIRPAKPPFRSLSPAKRRSVDSKGKQTSHQGSKIIFKRSMSNSYPNTKLTFKGSEKTCSTLYPLVILW